MFNKIKIRLLVLLIIVLAAGIIFLVYLHNKEKILYESIRDEGNLRLEFMINNLIDRLNYDNIDDNYLSELSSLTKAEIELVSSEQKKDIEKSISDLSAFNYAFVKPSLNEGNSGKIIFVRLKSEKLTQLGKKIGEEQIFVLSGFLFFILIITLAVYAQIVNPITLIISSVTSRKTEKITKLKKSKNEFGFFANLISEFFEQKKILEEEIKVRKITQEELETLNDELEKRVTDRTEELAITNLELQKERDQTKQYLDIAGTVITILDNDGYILMMNKKGDEVLGYQQGELLGKNWYNTCVHPRDRENFIKIHTEIMQGKEQTNSFNIGDVITKAKETRTFIFHKTFLKDGDTNNSSLLFSAEDITELKLKEKELIEAKEKADESNRLKSTFLANMSHELRTPMIGILGYSDLLINELVDDRFNKMAVAIHDSGQRLIDTLNLILDLSRLEANKHSIDNQVVNLNSLVKNITFHFEAAAGRKKLFLKTNIPGYDIVARTDPRMIRDILNNLINNAIKFTNSGGVFITLEVFHKSFIISVRDTGIGIPQKSLNIIFEEFRQVSEGLGRGFQGTGLGLTICKKYVELLGGEISVKSIQDEGSEFTFKIPLFAEDEFETENREKETLGEDNDYYPFILKETPKEKSRILVVEDDETSRDIIFLFLKNFYEITFAETGEQAIELTIKKKFDCIIMDINLGAGLTGIETKDEIRKIRGFENVPIIAATAFAMLGDKEKFLTNGFDHYLSKPYLKHQLLKMIEDILK